MKAYLNERGLRILKALDDISARLGSPAGAGGPGVADRRPSITAPIASATSLAQLEDLFAGVRLKLDRDAIKALDTASAY